VCYDVVREFLNSCVFFSFVAFPCILSCAYLSTDVSRTSGLTMKRGGTASSDSGLLGLVIGQVLDFVQSKTGWCCGTGMLLILTYYCTILF
jgi:hypothetical protein